MGIYESILSLSPQGLESVLPSIRSKMQPMTISSRIKEIMDEQHMNNVQFGKLIGVSHVAVGLWTSGETKNLKADVLFKIEEKTGYSARWIHSGKLPKKARGNRNLSKIAEKLSLLDSDQLKLAESVLDQMIRARSDLE